LRRALPAAKAHTCCAFNICRICSKTART
jgi:hypothetical protein